MAGSMAATSVVARVEQSVDWMVASRAAQLVASTVALMVAKLVVPRADQRAVD